MRGKKRTKRWYARETTWPGKVHRPQKVMTRVARLLAAKRKRDVVLKTPEARAKLKKSHDAMFKARKAFREQRRGLVARLLQEINGDAAA